MAGKARRYIVKLWQKCGMAGKSPLPRPTTADESAVAGHRLPWREGCRFLTLHSQPLTPES
jgi:hypothetical protein